MKKVLRMRVNGWHCWLLALVLQSVILPFKQKSSPLNAGRSSLFGWKQQLRSNLQSLYPFCCSHFIEFWRKKILFWERFFGGEVNKYLGETLFTTYPLLVRGL